MTGRVGTARARPRVSSGLAPEISSGLASGVSSGLALGVAGAGARLAWRALVAQPPGGSARWTRTNHRGAPLSLLEGPAVVAGATLAVLAPPWVPARVRVAGTVAVLGAGMAGLLDDLSGNAAAKGLRGHLGALRRGEVTTGALKIAGLGVSGLAAAGLLTGGHRPHRPHRTGRTGRAGRRGQSGRSGRVLDVAVGGALIAGTANLVNLFDLRPGRAIKVTLLLAPLAGGSVLSSAAAGSAGALLPADLGERAMLGDCGANALGALLGAAAVAGRSRGTRVALLVGVIGLTLASERVSFTAVIESTPGLREFDALGRRPR